MLHPLKLSQLSLFREFPHNPQFPSPLEMHYFQSTFEKPKAGKGKNYTTRPRLQLLTIRKILKMEVSPRKCVDFGVLEDYRCGCPNLYHTGVMKCACLDLLVEIKRTYQSRREHVSTGLRVGVGVHTGRRLAYESPA